MRLGRVACFAFAAVGLAAGAHLVGGGTVSPPVALACLPAVMLAVHGLAGRRRSVVGLLPVMALIQLALHELFMATAGAAACRVAGAGDPMSQMGGATSPPAMLHCGPSMNQAAMSGIWPPSLMLLGHLLATVLVAVLLARGEAAIWALAGWLGFRALRLSRPALLPTIDHRLPTPSYRAVRLISTVHRRNVRRRGPPPIGCALA